MFHSRYNVAMRLSSLVVGEVSGQAGRKLYYTIMKLSNFF